MLAYLIWNSLTSLLEGHCGDQSNLPINFCTKINCISLWLLPVTFHNLSIKMLVKYAYM